VGNRTAVVLRGWPGCLVHAGDCTGAQTPCLVAVSFEMG